MSRKKRELDEDRLDGTIVVKEFDDARSANTFCTEIEKANYQNGVPSLGSVLNLITYDEHHERLHSTNPKNEHHYITYSFVGYDSLLSASLSDESLKDLVKAQHAVQERLERKARELGGRDSEALIN